MRARTRLLGVALSVAGCGSAQSKPGQATPPPAHSAAVATPSLPPSASSSGCPAVDSRYEPRPAQTVEVHLPPVPELEKRATRVGEAYTVWGASHYLRSKVHHEEVNAKIITVEGYIVKTNLAEAPRCAVHRAGRANPENCFAPVPAFWIADTRDASPSSAMPVMGWASNYAQIYDAIRAFDAGTLDYVDVLWGIPLPNPLPAVGARVKVRGFYSKYFTLASVGYETNPDMGIVTYQELTYIEPAPELATLPGVRRAKPR